MLLAASQTWKTTYPGAAVGVLVMDEVQNPPEHAALEPLKAELEAALRRDYASMPRSVLEQQPSIRPYVDYYSRFNKSYHVLLQLESVAQKGKSLPHVAALVEAMFMAELKNQLLTAGHDFNVLQLPLKLDVADGSQNYTLLNGKEQPLKPGDMYVADQGGVISSIIYGPDRRTPITAATQKVLFVVYAPAGIGRERVEAHLADIQAYVRVVSPAGKTVTMEISPA